MPQEALSSAGASRARAERLAAFAADALDWPSVRALFERHVQSSLGRRALLELAPRSDADARAALERSRELGALLRQGQTPPLAGVFDPLPLIDRAREFGRALAAEELADLARFLRAAKDVGRWLEQRRDAQPMTAALAVGLPSLEPLRLSIEACVDPRGKVLDDASPRLRELLRESARLENHIDATLRRLASRPDLRRYLGDGEAGRVHRRAGRAVLAVKARHSGRVPGIVHDRSQSEETVFVEPAEVVEAANRQRILQADAEREVARILGELTRAVLAEERALAAAAQRLAELELALVGALFARECDGRPALLPGEPGAAGELLLRSMRHPLLVAKERAGELERCVPIDLRLGADFDMIVITGPNTGGKTLALKSAGLAVLITRLGLSIPCDEGTTVPLFDGVVADIGDEQEIEQSLSTFSSHLVRIVRGLARAGPRTLVLLDELGGGTDPDEGAALGDAILEALLARRAPTLASTHLGVLKEFAFRNPRAENACADFDADTLRPLYRLVVGTPGESKALVIARRLGLDPALIARAEKRLRRPHAEVAKLMEDVRSSRVAAEGLRSEAEERVQALERASGELAVERDDLVRARELLDDDAELRAEERLRGLRAALERLERLLDQHSGSARAELVDVAVLLRAGLEGESLGARRAAFLDGLRPGAAVFLPRYKRRGTVARVDKKRRRVTVRLGKRDLDLPFEEISGFETL